MMRALIAFLIFATSLPVAAQPTPVAQGVYRLPYSNGTEVFVSNSHDQHRNRLDLVGQGGASYTIVAAARGTVRVVVDNNQTFCPRPPASLNQFDVNGDDRVSSLELQIAAANSPANVSLIMGGAFLACSGHPGPSLCCMRGIESVMPCAAVGGPFPATCGAGGDGDGPNNYIWIEHENGEWTKYSHMRTGTALVSVGDTVNAGQAIATEGDIGIATGPHLHFHVAALDNVGQIGATGFATNDDGIAGINVRHRVPTFCQLGILEDNEIVTAVACDDLCTNANEIVGGLINNQSARLVQTSNGITTTVTVSPESGLSLRAGNRIRIQPGFHADGGSFFAATIGGCDRPGGVGE